MSAFKTSILGALFVSSSLFITNTYCNQEASTDSPPFFKPKPYKEGASDIPDDCRGVIVSRNNQRFNGLIPSQCSKNNKEFTFTSNTFPLKTRVTQSSSESPVTLESMSQDLIYTYTPLDNIRPSEIATINPNPTNSTQDVFILFGDQLIPGILICLGSCNITPFEEKENIPSGLLVLIRNNNSLFTVIGTTSEELSLTPINITTPSTPDIVQTSDTTDNILEPPIATKEITFSSFTGAGLSPGGSTSGTLDSYQWSFSGLAGETFHFGSTLETGASAPVYEGSARAGLNALEHMGNTYIWLQPDHQNLAPGTATLRIQNRSGSPLSQLKIDSQILLYNDQTGTTQVTLSYATTSSTDTVEPIFQSLESLSSGIGWPEGLTTSTITGIVTSTVPDRGYLYIRWSLESKGSSSESYDELGIGPVGITQATTPLFRVLREAHNEERFFPAAANMGSGDGGTEPPIEPETSSTPDSISPTTSLVMDATSSEPVPGITTSINMPDDMMPASSNSLSGMTSSIAIPDEIAPTTSISMSDDMMPTSSNSLSGMTSSIAIPDDITPTTSISMSDNMMPASSNSVPGMTSSIAIPDEMAPTTSVDRLASITPTTSQSSVIVSPTTTALSPSTQPATSSSMSSIETTSQSTTVASSTPTQLIEETPVPTTEGTMTTDTTTHSGAITTVAGKVLAIGAAAIPLFIQRIFGF